MLKWTRHDKSTPTIGPQSFNMAKPQCSMNWYLRSSLILQIWLSSCHNHHLRLSIGKLPNKSPRQCHMVFLWGEILSEVTHDDKEAVRPLEFVLCLVSLLGFLFRSKQFDNPFHAHIHIGISILNSSKRSFNLLSCSYYIEWTAQSDHILFMRSAIVIYNVSLAKRNGLFFSSSS